MLTIRKANLVHIIQRRSSGGEAIQPVAPAPTGSARLAVLGCIPRPRLWGSVLHEGRWLFFLLFCRELGRGLLFLEGHSFLKERRIPFLFRRELGRGQLLLLEWDGFLRGRGLHFTLSLKVRALLRSVRGIPGESVAQGWGRGCSIASFLKEVLCPQLPLPWSLGNSLWDYRSNSQIGQDQGCSGRGPHPGARAVESSPTQ